MTFLNIPIFLSFDIFIYLNWTSYTGFTSSDTPAPASGDLQPPSSLQEFPSLASYLNSILEAFNEMRLCCPAGLSKSAPTVIAGSLNCVVAVLLEYNHMEEAAFTENERNIFLRYLVILDKAGLGNMPLATKRSFILEFDMRFLP